MIHRQGITFLLGAGSSIDAGLPGAVELFKRFRTYLDGRRSIVRAIDLWDRLCATLERDGGPPVDIEAPFIALETLRRRRESPLFPFVEAWRSWLDVDDFEYKCLELMGLLRTFLLEQLGRPVRTDYLSPLLLLNFPGGVDIFTLNYDIALELAAHFAGRSFTTGFSGNVLRVDGAQFEVWDSTSFARAEVRIYKLHGSLRWVTNNWPPAHLVLRERKIDGFQEGIRRTHEANVKVHFAWSSAEIRIPPLIFGGQDKLHPSSPYAFLFVRFAEAASKAAAIVTVGYSWRDTHINNILLSEL